MKYKLTKKTEKLQGRFTVGRVYKTKPYSSNEKLCVLIDDDGRKHLTDIEKSNFQEHFLNINKERKEKLIQIEYNNENWFRQKYFM